MRKPLSHSVASCARQALAAVAAAASLGLLACGVDAGPPDERAPANASGALKIGPTPINPPVNPRPVAPPPAKDQSFGAPFTWTQGWGSDAGWGFEEPRLLADVNGDKLADLVGFGDDAVEISLSGSRFFWPMQTSVSFFTYNTGWRTETHVRTLADLNHDGRADIVGFGDGGVYTSLGSPSGFGPVVLGLADFGSDQGWTTASHVRTLADVNGDHTLDIVGFFDDGVYVALGSGTGTFAPKVLALADMGLQAGWDPATTVRTTSDVNGDGYDDLVGFGLDGVYVAISSGAKPFAPAARVLQDFGYGEGWRVTLHPRALADIDNDGKKDIVGFGNAGMYTAHCNGSGFDAAKLTVADLGYAQGWRVGRDFRAVADLNGDGYEDVFGAGEDAVVRALGGPNGLGPLRPMLRDFTASAGYGGDELDTPRFLGDLNGDGELELVGISDSDVRASYSTASPPFSAPPAPINFSLTADSPTTLSFHWEELFTNTQNDALAFVVTSRTTFGAEARETLVTTGAPLVTAPLVEGTVTLDGLDSAMAYGVSVQAENLWGISAPTVILQGKTSSAPPGGPPGGINGTAPAAGASVTACGTALTSCPTGYHATGYAADAQCLGTLAFENALTCAPNAGTYIGCGLGYCAKGFSSASSAHVASCDLDGTPSDGASNATVCVPITAQAFTACLSCPPGYSQSASTATSESCDFPLVTCQAFTFVPIEIAKSFSSPQSEDSSGPWVPRDRRAVTNSARCDPSMTGVDQKM